MPDFALGQEPQHLGVADGLDPTMVFRTLRCDCDRQCIVREGFAHDTSCQGYKGNVVTPDAGKR